MIEGGIKSAVMRRIGAVGIERLAAPAPNPGDAVIRVDACGVCGSDVALFRGRKGTGDLPLVPGHEIVGTVVQTGDGAPHLRRGDRVALEEGIACHQCSPCLRGAHRLCERAYRFGGTSLDAGGELLGGFAEFVRLPAGAIAHPVPADLNPALATLFIPLSNGVSWIREAGELRPGESVLVLGAGQHGLACVAMARHSGAGTIILGGLPQDRERLELGATLGADLVIDTTSPNAPDAIREATDGAGPGVIVDATPSAGGPLALALAVAAVGARIVVAGLKRGAREEGFDTDLMCRKELTVRGVWGRSSWAVPVALKLLATEDSLAALAGPEFPLEETELAIRTLAGMEACSPPVHVTVIP